MDYEDFIIGATILLTPIAIGIVFFTLFDYHDDVNFIPQPLCERLQISSAAWRVVVAASLAVMLGAFLLWVWPRKIQEAT